MSFFYDKDAGQLTLKIDGQLFEHIFKIRRTRDGEVLEFRNLQDSNLYRYEVQYIEKKSANLKLNSSQLLESKGNGVHIGWCVIDPKSIEKTLPMLNELGVKKIDFIYSKRSQRNFNIRPERFDSIIISSCQQCQRSDMMKFELFDSLETWTTKHNKFAVLDFNATPLPQEPAVDVFLIGPEGGFTEDEREMLRIKSSCIYSLNTNLTLKSETACVLVASLANI